MPALYIPDVPKATQLLSNKTDSNM